MKNPKVKNSNSIANLSLSMEFARNSTGNINSQACMSIASLDKIYFKNMQYSH